MKKILFTLFLALAAVPALACTSVIISGKVRADGRPVMMKHRDTSHKTNDILWFQGEKYAFIGLVNTDVPLDKEIWAGTNSAGFSIMNTATYDLKEDDVPAEKMDREGFLMYRALEICATVEDFEHFIDTLSKPMGVEANFGVIDAQGGAVYYEMGWLRTSPGRAGKRTARAWTAMRRPAACSPKPAFPSPNGTTTS